MPIADSPTARKLSRFLTLCDQELSVLNGLQGQRRQIAAGRDVIHQVQLGHSAFFLTSGWVFLYKLLADGSRQIIDFHLPGDLLGLRSILLRTVNHSIEAVTKVEVSEVLATDILDAFNRAPAFRQQFCGRLA